MVSEPMSVMGLEVTNFKSIGDTVGVTFGNITVLAGANSSGKSSFMQPLLLLKQTLDKSYDPGGIDISGPNASFTSTEQIFSSFSDDPLYELGFPLTEGKKINLTYKKQNDGRIDLSSVTLIGTHATSTYDFGDPLSGTSIDPEISKLLFRATPVPLHAAILQKSTMGRRRGFPRMESKKDGALIDLYHQLVGEGLLGDVSQLVGRLIHIPGLRGNPARTYPASAVSNIFPGLFTDYVASVIHHWKATKDSRLATVGADLRKLGLTWKVDTRSIDDTRVEVRVARLPVPKRSGAQDMVSIADVGLGVSQVLPIVVALLAAEAGQVVYIEQPEIHLHPRAQVALAEILCRAGKRGVKVVVETLSGVLVLALQAMVAEGTLPADELKLHWFSRNERGMTEVRLAELGDDGSYGDWPEDFGEVELQLQQRYLDAIGRMRAGQ